MPPKTTKTVKAKAGRYFEAVGRRKNAVARVRLHVTKTNSSVTINDKELTKYFPVEKYQRTVLAPFTTLSLTEYEVTAKVLGGGVTGQAEAIRLGIARALVIINPVWRTPLKVLGYLKRDPRMVERKKPGLRKARRPQQWRKR